MLKARPPLWRKSRWKLPIFFSRLPSAPNVPRWSPSKYWLGSANKSKACMKCTTRPMGDKVDPSRGFRGLMPPWGGTPRVPRAKLHPQDAPSGFPLRGALNPFALRRGQPYLPESLSVHWLYTSYNAFPARQWRIYNSILYYERKLECFLQWWTTHIIQSIWARAGPHYQTTPYQAVITCGVACRSVGETFTAFSMTFFHTLIIHKFVT